MNHAYSYDALIIDPDLDSRIRLKQATVAIPSFEKGIQISNFKDALERLQDEDKVDLVFISHRFPHNEILEFLGQARCTKQGEDAAYILVVLQSEEDAGKVATNVINGLDGFLFEPFSVSSLHDITALATKVRKQRTMARNEAALRFLITDLMNHIDHIASLKALKQETGPTQRKFKDLCKGVDSLSNDLKQIYTEIAIDMFIEAPPPRRVFQRRVYKGASLRVRKKLGLEDPD